ncbi:hypothetical protein NDU88_003240 [Pleurodeles waltl]|uniref:Uncharacterized protein n=1 Tax=Pleurodeles waltl TaxID=8319 RepID=A0AAV7UEM7_PLEWA|nr:hypothetical protein NDU88_003240 [Pleurodeles waltl]
MTLDFRVPGIENREDGRQSGKEEEEDAVEPKETASGDWDQHERSSGNPDVPREGTDPVEEERSEDTRGGRHVPGGAWLTKIVWALADKEITLDRIVTARDQGSITFEGSKIWLYQDLSYITLQRRRALKPAAIFLREKGVMWGRPFQMLFAWQGETHVVRTLSGAYSILGLDQENPSSLASQH